VNTAELEHVCDNEGSKQAEAVLPGPDTAVRPTSRGRGYKRPSSSTSQPGDAEILSVGQGERGRLPWACVSSPHCWLLPSMPRVDAAPPWAAKGVRRPIGAVTTSQPVGFLEVESWVLAAGSRVTGTAPGLHRAGARRGARAHRGARARALSMIHSDYNGSCW